MREYIAGCENNKVTIKGEIVRCADCRYVDLFSCPLVDNDFQKDEDFCSWGERKEKVQLSPETSTNKVDTPTDLISRQAAIEEIKNATTITGWNKYASQEEIVDDVERQLRRLFVGAIESLPPVEPKTDLVNRSDVLELAKSGVLISNDNYKKVCEAINGLPSCHCCRECEPVEPPVCEDAISRADTIKAMCRECTQEGYDECREDCTEVAVVKGMPPVEPERPKGEWYLVDHLWECNRCQYRQNKSKPTNFCPNCGADMRGEEDE